MRLKDVRGAAPEVTNSSSTAYHDDSEDLPNGAVGFASSSEATNGGCAAAAATSLSHTAIDSGFTSAASAFITNWPSFGPGLGNNGHLRTSHGCRSTRNNITAPRVPVVTSTAAPVWPPAPILASALPLTPTEAPVPAPDPVLAPSPVPIPAPSAPAPSTALTEAPARPQTRIIAPSWFPVPAPSFPWPSLPFSSLARARLGARLTASTPAPVPKQEADATAQPPPESAAIDVADGDSAGASAPLVTTKEALAASSEPKTNLIINYLPQSMTQEELRSLFASVGEIQSCKLVRNKITGESLGYGFINYVDPRDAEKALCLLNGLRYPPKVIKVSYARPNSSSIRDANLYISGLPKSMSEKELEEVFSPFGNIIALKILSDKVSGASRGVGFILFDKKAEAEDAIKALHGQKPCGFLEHLTVKFAHHQIHKIPQSLLWQLYQSPYPFCAPLQPPASRFGLNSLFNMACRVPHFSSSLVDGTRGMTLPGYSSNGWCIFVYNLSPDCDESILWKLFGPFGAVSDVKIVRDFNTQKCRHFGFVTMANYNEAAIAIASLNGYCLGSRVLQVSFKINKVPKARIA